MSSKRLPADRPLPHAATDIGKKYQPRYAVAVECRDEREQQRLYKRLRRQGLEPKVLVL